MELLRFLGLYENLAFQLVIPLLKDIYKRVER